MPMKMRLIAAALLAISLTVHASAADSWDGTWVGGFQNGGNGVQLIFVGNELIGFFFNGDYLDVRSSYSKTDGVVMLTWQRGQATLTRDGATAGHLLVAQRNLPDVRIEVKPDK
jgi:hypothetical protein